ncbi:MAG: 16S rRNA (cytidine(1402)-2'-O)-methyltransferase [Rhodospirillales bacterium]
MTRKQPDRAKPGKPLSPGLHVVATPIGNAADITLRALEVFRNADVIACEDTRITGKLLHIHGIEADLTPYHEHNAARVRPALIERLKAGQTVALASDAGTPLINDPGYKLVTACRAEGIAVTAEPGASAVMAALVVSGLLTDRFLFAGFLPVKQAARARTLETLRAVPATLVFMESPKRLAAALADMADVLGAREAAVARELTKLHEEVRRGTLADLAEQYAGAAAPKGEAMIVIAPPGEEEPLGENDLDGMIRDALGRGSVRDAVREIVEATGLSRRDVYARALEIEKSRHEPRG